MNTTSGLILFQNPCTVHEVFNTNNNFLQFHHDAHKTLSEVRVSTDHTVLYFPLKNTLDKVVGYRKLQAGNEEAIENHGLHSAGLFYCRAPKVGRSDQAVIVPSIQDVLSLAAEKVPGMLILTLH